MASFMGVTARYSKNAIFARFPPFLEKMCCRGKVPAKLILGSWNGSITKKLSDLYHNRNENVIAKGIAVPICENLSILTISAKHSDACLGTTQLTNEVSVSPR